MGFRNARNSADALHRATVLLHDILVNPDGFYNHVRRYNASVFNIITWGQRGATYDSFWSRVRINSRVW